MESCLPYHRIVSSSRGSYGLDAILHESMSPVEIILPKTWIDEKQSRELLWFILSRNRHWYWHFQPANWKDRTSFSPYHCTTLYEGTISQTLCVKTTIGGISGTKYARRKFDTIATSPVTFGPGYRYPSSSFWSRPSTTRGELSTRFTSVLAISLE